MVIPDDDPCDQNVLYICINNVELNKCVMSDRYIISSSIKKVHLEVDM